MTYLERLEAEYAVMAEEMHEAGMRGDADAIARLDTEMLPQYELLQKLRREKEKQDYVTGLLKWATRLFENAENDADMKESMRILDAIFENELPRFRR